MAPQSTTATYTLGPRKSTRPGHFLWPLVVLLSLLSTTGCWIFGTDVSGVWKGNIHSSGPGRKWDSPAELVLNQHRDAITGSLSFHGPQGNQVQVPISSGVLAKDVLTLTGQAHLPMGTIDVSFHGTVDDSNLTGNADVTVRAMLFGGAVNHTSLTLEKQ